MDPWTVTLAVVGAITALRVVALFVSPLELYPDEAQYWLWSRRLALGYFSKPPMIAWLIAATTAVGGDGEAWVRLSAPLAHGAAALLLHRAAARWFEPRAGLLAALVYTLMPGVELSSVVVATDAPLLACLAGALWATAALWAAPAGERGGGRAAAALGLALGLGALSKYAALYFVAGLAAHALADPAGRRRLWSRRRLAIAAGAFVLVLSPNVAWNAAHHFETLAHTAADANLGDPRHAGGFDPRGPVGFLLGQAGVFGPVPLAALAAAVALNLRPARRGAPEALLAWLTLPPILVVLAEAALVRANANWAAAAYVPGAVLAARALMKAPWRPWRIGGLGLQALACALMALTVLSPAVADGLGLANSFKRARGWARTAAVIRDDLAVTRARGPVSALAVDDRFLFNALSYYGRAWVAAPGAPPLRMWVHEARARNQAEVKAALTGRDGARVAFASITWPRETRWDFRDVQDVREARIPLDARRARDLLLFTGSGFAPRPRDPRRGLPIPPPGAEAPGAQPAD